ncbi:Extradiol ring-cleavage dioxygenase, class III enzyme, subunit B [Rhizoctonia solani]|uniref:Extradiol ring-cleavage dioxygenase, class III enzyme, subunit B n=1 Tax=Rhizoctonia solani TaxID=456999 RepID=A0A8H7HAZ4_9AGAM|nr:Extradiol ring-cleavage dioxygenase, class III enzyme, subunit B [Rhizoctonia solani]
MLLTDNPHWSELLLFALAPLVLFALAQFFRTLSTRLFSAAPVLLNNPTITKTMSGAAPTLPTTDEAWKAALDALPTAEANNGKIPAFFFAHGSPMLLRDTSPDPRFDSLKNQAGKGALARFLSVFGPALLDKYKPKGIVVFSAHWEERGQVLVTDYQENPLLMDYYGFEDEMYQVQFKSRGDSALSARVVAAVKEGGLKARTLGTMESRGKDGRPRMPGTGLDHGVFVPFKIMFGDEFTSVPIVEVSQDESLSPDRNWEIGKTVDVLRSEGYLILSGGLTVHTFRDWSAWKEESAAPPYIAFHKAILEAVQVQDPSDRRIALSNLTRHPGFRLAHPREEHFTPIYLAAGAGEKGRTQVLDATYGQVTVAFGIEV